MEDEMRSEEDIKKEMEKEKVATRKKLIYLSVVLRSSRKAH